jgi:UDP-N-acetylmuramoylalanine--D-glutamate ligase
MIDMQKHFQNVVVVGLGKTGLSCVNFCKQQGWQVSVTDSRSNPPCSDQIDQHTQTAFGKISKELIDHADLLIISPGVSLKEPVIANAIKNGIPYVGDVELFVQCITAPIIAITGSNAKSTVTSLVGEMARQDNINVQVAGNIGMPVLDLLQQPQADLYVLELSSFQLETTHSLHAKIAVILNIYADHLDRYENIQEYIAAKMKIYQNCETGIFNRAANFYQPFLPELNIKQIISFGLDAPDKNQYGLLQNNLAKGNKKLLEIKKLKLTGQHNIENALAALAIGDAAGISQAAMLKALQTFSGLPHRCQLVRAINNVAWYNDSKGTNVGATLAALEGFGKSINGKIILIAGGLGKNADFTPLQTAVKNYTREIILIGEATSELAEVLHSRSTIKTATTLDEAIQFANKAALPGDIVLLSPACASFDMFNDYQHRGDEFTKIVNAI